MLQGAAARTIFPTGQVALEANPRRINVTKTSLILGITLLVALGGMVDAQRGGGGQRGGIDPGAVATALPLEGAPLAVPGPYKIESGPAFDSPGHVVFRPSDLSPFPSRDT